MDSRVFLWASALCFGGTLGVFISWICGLRRPRPVRGLFFASLCIAFAGTWIICGQEGRLLYQLWAVLLWFLLGVATQLVPRVGIPLLMFFLGSVMWLYVGFAPSVWSDGKEGLSILVWPDSAGGVRLELSQGDITRFEYSGSDELHLSYQILLFSEFLPFVPEKALVKWKSGVLGATEPGFRDRVLILLAEESIQRELVIVLKPYGRYELVFDSEEPAWVLAGES